MEAILKYKVKVFLKSEISEQMCSAGVEILSVIRKGKFRFGQLHPSEAAVKPANCTRTLQEEKMLRRYYPANCLVATLKLL